MMKERILYLSYLLLVLFFFSSCGSKNLGPTIPIPEGQGEGSAIDAPGVRIIDVKTDAFTANWKMVADALEYEYVFDDGKVSVTRDTTLTFEGLEADSEHVFRICAVPRKESGRLRSEEVVVHVLTSEVLPLDSPALALGTATTGTTVISWGVVPDAESYEWELGEQKGSTFKTFLVFQGLLEGNKYLLRVRAVASDSAVKASSDWAEIEFTPVRDGSEKMYFSNFNATCDAISFNVYANKGQYYLYDIIPLVKYNTYESQQEYIASLKAGIDAQAEVLIAAGKTTQEAYAEVLKSGSANVLHGAFASLTYMVTVFGMDLAGNISTEITSKQLVTPATLDSDGPAYEEKGDWFKQTLMLGSTDATSTTYVYFNRKGTGVTDVKYLLYTTAKFTKTFGETLDQDAINQIKSTVTSSGATASETALEKINSSAGYTAGYSGREPGTSYTVVALATNEYSETKLAVNSIRTRSTTEKNNWISYSLKSRSTTDFTIAVVLDGSLDAVAGGFYYAPLSEVTSQYTRAQYRELVLSKATPLTAQQLSELNTNGSTNITVTGLDSATQYFVGSYATDSVDDTTVLTSSVITK